MILVACDGGGKTPPDAKHVDASGTIDAPMIDAPMIDAPTVDAPMIDAPVSMDITTACMHACDKLGTCLGEPVEAQCYSDCAADLGDCTMQQVMDVDQCTQLACGNMGDAIMTCLEAIACVMG
ncbi:MAG: hypothetical protein H0T46_36015 [Deltaproteobacteria bacterium]|nr:hypothetical protein [Deltaproteobacteria bacterium]